MKKLRTILIDDEPLALKRLRRLLEPFEAIIDIVDTAENGLQAVKKINALSPDLVFLDIQMPGLNGFQVLEALGAKRPKVIFATAYDQYALKAFEENSIDYLLKPIEKSRLQKTIDKLKVSEESAISPQLLQQLLGQLEPKKAMQSISVKQGEKIKIISLKEVSFFQASGKYVVLHHEKGQQYIINYTIKILNEKLPTREFIQVSRGTIINKSKISELERFFNGKYKITLKDAKNSQVESGSTFGDEVKGILDL